MAEIIGIHDGGIAKDRYGHTVGIIVFMITTNESKPEILIGHCRPNYRDSIIKNLKRLTWQKPDAIEKT